MKFNTKIIGWIITIVIVIGALYTLAFKEPVINGASATESVGSDLLELLDKLKGVSFDTDLFSNSKFSSLKDWSITLPAPDLGRPNPFERIGVDIGTVAPIGTPQQTATTTAP